VRRQQYGYQHPAKKECRLQEYAERPAEVVIHDGTQPREYDEKKAKAKRAVRHMRVVGARRLCLAAVHRQEVRAQKQGHRTDAEHDAELLEQVN